MRVAIFFTPSADHPLTKAASLWLGRDAFSGENFPQAGGEGLTTPEIEAMTAAPRRYGFHATLKPPFHLASGRQLDDLEASVDSACKTLHPVDLGTLRVARIGSFFALTPAEISRPAHDLAAEIVRSLDDFRAPPSKAEIERRRPDRLTARQRDNLERWGYPYVFDDFRFHMTLTGEVAEDRRVTMERLLAKRFSPLLDEPVEIDAVSLFVEPEPPGNFRFRKRIELSSSQKDVDAA